MGERARVTNHIHELERVNHGGKPFTCNDCKVQGSGTRYRCKPCNFNLHPYCTVCPAVLTSSAHRHRELTLLNASTTGHTYLCKICNQNIQGTFYHCNKANDFSAHPVCVEQRLISHQSSTPAQESRSVPWPYSPGVTYDYQGSNAHSPHSPHYATHYGPGFGAPHNYGQANYHHPHPHPHPPSFPAADPARPEPHSNGLARRVLRGVGAVLVAVTASVAGDQVVNSLNN